MVAMARKNPKGPDGTPAVRALTAAGVPFTMRAYEHDPGEQSFGLEAATALGVPAHQVFKTLVVQTDLQTDKGLVQAVVPVDRQLDLKALASSVGSKHAALADPALAERITGYVVGGISPVGGKRVLRTVVDQSALDLPTMLVSGGRRGTDVELSPDDLVRTVRASVAPIAR